MGTSEATKLNAFTFNNEMIWLSNKIDHRLDLFFKSDAPKFEEVMPPEIKDDPSNYANFIRTYCTDDVERIIIVMALAHYFKPELFDRFLIKNKGLGKNFTEFGGKTSDKTENIFVPTLRTVAFILFGDQIPDYFRLQFYFADNHFFKIQNAVMLNKENHSFLDATLVLGREFLQNVTNGNEYKPNYSTEFPANLITTDLDWEDLVLESYIFDEIDIVNTWLNNRDQISQNKLLSKKINKGYKCLFYGPPGTGKTLSATLLGKKNNLDVFQVDLSQVVSKYIGETEKNLASIFDIAENKNWILFFDEAESLFSKRTAVNDAKDKFANQETAYLLQRVENYNGLIILATNLKPNIDLAFSRRLQSVINYAIPNHTQRKALWTNALNGIADLSETEIDKVSKTYIISGGSIKNVIQYAWLKSKVGNTSITLENIMIGIRRELAKDGKSFEK
ncbi:ATP-binding protein [Flavobacteriaceae bacterium]|nr:ATP-binding protein [Flavobacteriaceae bacterium]